MILCFSCLQSRERTWKINWDDFKHWPTERSLFASCWHSQLFVKNKEMFAQPSSVPRFGEISPNGWNSVGDEIFGHFASEIWPKSGEIRKFHENLLFFSKNWPKIQHFQKNFKIFSKHFWYPFWNAQKWCKNWANFFYPYYPQFFPLYVWLCLLKEFEKL